MIEVFLIDQFKTHCLRGIGCSPFDSDYAPRETPKSPDFVCKLDSGARLGVEITQAIDRAFFFRRGERERAEGRQRTGPPQAPVADREMLVALREGRAIVPAADNLILAAMVKKHDKLMSIPKYYLFCEFQFLLVYTFDSLCDAAKRRGLELSIQSVSAVYARHFNFLIFYAAGEFHAMEYSGGRYFWSDLNRMRIALTV